jgi:serine/threonine protein kinase
MSNRHGTQGPCNIPLYIIIHDKLYLNGFSYAATSREQKVITYDPEDRVNCQVLRDCLKTENSIAINTVLTKNPSIIRLLTDSELLSLFQLLIHFSFEKHLQEIFGVVFLTSAKTETNVESLELFGRGTKLLHKYLRPTDKLTKFISIDNTIGRGSFGHVFSFPDSKKPVKFNYMTSEFVREFLCNLTLTVMSDDLSPEVRSETSVHLMPLHMFSMERYVPINRMTLYSIISEIPGSEEYSGIDQVAFLIRKLLQGIRDLRDRYIMHLDLSWSNIMWNPKSKNVQVIDYAGTIGDDTFYDLDEVTDKICTSTTRPLEYFSGSLWQRNESSEGLSAYYAIISHVLPIKLMDKKPYQKEDDCRIQVAIEQPDDPEKKCEILRRVHSAGRGKIQQRTSLDWILSDGTEQGDKKALELGTVGTKTRYVHVLQSIHHYIGRWPVSNEDVVKAYDQFWKDRRATAVNSILDIIECPAKTGCDCQGLLDNIVPPPYTFSRSIMLYDTIRSLVLQIQPEHRGSMFQCFMDPPLHNVLVKSIVYLSLCPTKMILVDINHFPGHPLHILLQFLNDYPNLISLFLSPITAYILILFETPYATEPTLASTEKLRHMLRCLYSTDGSKRRSPVKVQAELPGIRKFVRSYLSRLIAAPLFIKSCDDWWNFLMKSQEQLEEYSTDLSSKATNYIDSVIRLWFT